MHMGSGPKLPQTQIEGGLQSNSEVTHSASEVMSSAATYIASANAMSPTPPLSILALPKICATCKNRYPREFRVCPQDGTQLDDALEDDTLIGAVLAGSYQVLRLVGEGGMGRVYEARHVRLTGKHFAIKLLLDEYAHQPELLARFEREAQSAATIDHPNVVEVVDVCRLEDGRPFIVTEFLEGEELGALLDRVGKLPNDMSIRITRQICRALMAAHAKGIVHRDMKPENVFLVGDLTSPRVKIIDFGISKQDDCNAKLTRTGMVMGTPAYMAPEQARGEHVDNRADVYGVGGILYRCVTGHKPYEGDDGAMVLTQVLTEEPKRPRAVEPTVPGELEVVIERAMARDTADRLPSMADFEAELAALDSSPVAVDGALPSMLPSAPLNWPDAVQVQDKTSTRTQHAMRTKREARGARPMLVLTTAIGYLWCAALLVSGIADAIRFSKSSLVRLAGMPPDAPALALGGKLTANESVLVALGVLAATITPLLIWVRHLGRKVWRNTASSVAFAARAKASLSAGISTYGLSMLALAITESVVLRLSPGTLQTVWGVPIVVASFAMLLITWWMLARRRM